MHKRQLRLGCALDNPYYGAPYAPVPGCRQIKLLSCQWVERPGARQSGEDRAAATRCLRSMRSRDDTAKRSAARQTTLSSNSLTLPSA